jgi:hypothetical protein
MAVMPKLHEVWTRLRTLEKKVTELMERSSS